MHVIIAGSHEDWVVASFASKPDLAHFVNYIIALICRPYPAPTGSSSATVVTSRLPVRRGSSEGVPNPERENLQFRAEAFNVLNNVRFNNPSTTFSNPSTFGNITSAQDPSILQSFIEGALAAELAVRERLRWKGTGETGYAIECPPRP
jgi:hypothetical protein